MMEETKETKTTEKAPEVTKEVQMTINDIIAKYRQIQNDYNILLERYVEISEEKREYELVNDAIKGLDGERKCWRMIGGLLVEKNVKVVLPELAVQIENMKKIIASLEDSITRKAQEMKAHETKYEPMIKELIKVKKEREEKKVNPATEKAGVLI